MLHNDHTKAIFQLNDKLELCESDVSPDTSVVLGNGIYTLAATKLSPFYAY